MAGRVAMWRGLARGLVAFVGAGFAGVAFVFVIGLLIPAWTAAAIWGEQAVWDSPGHGAAIFMGGVLIALGLAVPVVAFSAILILEKLSGSKCLGRHPTSVGADRER